MRLVLLDIARARLRGEAVLAPAEHRPVRGGPGVVANMTRVLDLDLGLVVVLEQGRGV